MNDDPYSIRCIGVLWCQRRPGTKKIFLALQKLAKRGKLEIPVIGVANSGWELERKAIRDWAPGLNTSMEIYRDPATFQRLRQELESNKHPLHYLAIPPMLFADVLKQLQVSDCAEGSRVVLEKPFGHDLASALCASELGTG